MQTNTDYTGEWMSDYAMVELVGIWWDGDEEHGDEQGALILDEGAGSNDKQHWLREANAALRARGYTIEVIDVRDMDDYLEWLVL